LNCACPIDCFCQESDFFQLLFGKGHPATHLTIQLRLDIQIERRMQERTRWRNFYAFFSEDLDGRFQTGDRVLNIGAPNIAPIHKTQ
jgi:hypothetical protein